MDGGIPLDRIIDFTPVDGHLFRGLHAQTDFVAANFDDDNRDVIVDDDAFVFLPREHQHDGIPFHGAAVKTLPTGLAPAG